MCIHMRLFSYVYICVGLNGFFSLREYFSHFRG